MLSISYLLFSVKLQLPQRQRHGLIHCGWHVVVVWSLSCVWLFCDYMDCSLPGSSVNGISQARIWGGLPLQGSQPSSILHCRLILYCWATKRHKIFLRSGATTLGFFKTKKIGGSGFPVSVCINMDIIVNIGLQNEDIMYAKNLHSCNRCGAW